MKKWSAFLVRIFFCDQKDKSYILKPRSKVFDNKSCLVVERVLAPCPLRLFKKQIEKNRTRSFLLLLLPFVVLSCVAYLGDSITYGTTSLRETYGKIKYLRDFLNLRDNRLIRSLTYGTDIFRPVG